MKVTKQRRLEAAAHNQKALKETTELAAGSITSRHGVLKTFQSAHKRIFQPVMKVTKQRRLEAAVQQRNHSLSANMNLSIFGQHQSKKVSLQLLHRYTRKALAKLFLIRTKVDCFEYQTPSQNH